jgi:SAM-dependent methyltransferase
MKCRFCKNKLTNVFADLVSAPISNAMLTEESIHKAECYYPLKVYVCDHCKLVQVDENNAAQEFFNEEYTYFSSYSSSWLKHAKKYVDMMMQRFSFNKDSLITEIASNDGYLLQYFKEYEIPVLGIEPSANTAIVAQHKDIDTIVDFFGTDLARKHFVEKSLKSDLIVGNNVLAHVPDINDFVEGLSMALSNSGIITMEFPHLLRLVKGYEFDTIYHEHYSYLSLITVKRLFESHGLVLFDVEAHPTHGGSLRIFAKHHKTNLYPVSQNVEQILHEEDKAGMNTKDFYSSFQNIIDDVKYEFWEFLINQKRRNKKIIGYGAAAKGNTLINYCGIKGTDLIEYVADTSPHKQGKNLPGSRIPVVSPDKIKETQPDFIIIFPWNLEAEIREQLSFAKEWDAQFVTFIPKIKIC